MPQQPTARPLSPPATPEQLVRARRPRPAWPTWLLGAGLILLTIQAFTAGITPRTAAQQQVLDLARGWATPAGVVALTLGAVALLLGWTREPSGPAAVRVLSAAGRALHLGPHQLTLHKPRWKTERRTRRLLSGFIGYAPGQVTEDLGSDLTEALAPFLAGAVTIRWEPDHDRFSVSPRPVTAPLLQEVYSTVHSMTRTLEHLLGPLEVDQHATLVDDSGTVVEYVARYGRTTRDLADSFRQRLKVILDAKSPCPTGYWTVKLDPATSRITVLPSRPMPTVAELPLVIPSPDERMRIPIGVAGGEEVVWWDPAITPHMLLVGPTGSGKTIFLNSMIDLAAARAWHIDLLDPKELSYRGFIAESRAARGLPPWPCVNRVATSELEMEEAIDDLYEDLRERYCQLKIFGVTERSLRPRLAIIDEAGEMVERLNAFHTSEAKHLAMIEKAIAEGRNPDEVSKPKGTRNPQLAKLWSLLRLGRQAKIFVITATQRPDVNFIPGEARTNLVARVAMGKQDGAALEMVFQTRNVQQRVHETVVDPATGRKLLQRIRGRATVDVGQGPVSIQTWWTPDPALLITGELNHADQQLVKRQYDFVRRASAIWQDHDEAADLISGQINPEWTGFDTPAPPDIVDKKKALVSHALHADLDKPPDNAAADRPAPQKAAPAKSLRPGDTAVLELDGEDITVEITEVEDDPSYLGEEDDIHELQITYRIADGHPRAGELGVTTLADDEPVTIEA